MWGERRDAVPLAADQVTWADVQAVSGTEQRS